MCLRAGAGKAMRQARAQAGSRLSFGWFNSLISGLWQGDLWWGGTPESRQERNRVAERTQEDTVSTLGRATSLAIHSFTQQTSTEFHYMQALL